MKTEVRLLIAVGLMILVMVGTNILFPPVQPEEGALGPDSVAAELTEGEATGGASLDQLRTAAGEGAELTAAPDPAAEQEEEAAAAVEATPEVPAIERTDVVVDGPLVRYVFDNYGAALTTLELKEFEALTAENGLAQLIPPGTRALQSRVVVGSDTLNLESAPFTVEPAGGLTLEEGAGPQTLTFTWTGGGGAASVEVAYTFRPDSYLVEVENRINGIPRALLFTSLGSGLAFNDADSVQEANAMAYVRNHLNDGIDAELLTKVGEDDGGLEEGPFRWVAFKSRYFVTAILPGSGAPGEEVYFGGLQVRPRSGDYSTGVGVAQPVTTDGVHQYRLFMGPQEYDVLQALGADMEDVNPYGWRFFRPIIRPFVGFILTFLNFLHDTLKLGYGWVLILFGVLMRVVLWPLNQKAMRAQLKNMAVQPLVQDIQKRYKNEPEKLQKEMGRLMKEHGYNPLGGCLPMLLPWPILIALFFVFQNTIELRGVEFLWLPDLSAKDPFYILPLFLAVSMFLLQFISLRSMPQSNPQLKFMMWFMPLFFGFIFLQFPSGLNLYYATANIATIPQQLLIARERKKVKPFKVGGSSGDGDGGSGDGGGSDSGSGTSGGSKSGGKKSRRNRKK